MPETRIVKRGEWVEVRLCNDGSSSSDPTNIGVYPLIVTSAAVATIRGRALGCDRSVESMDLRWDSHLSKQGTWRFYDDQAY
jgi:hypothetical protein